MKQKTKLLWKTIPANLESKGHKWKLNKWYHIAGEIELCRNGFHASPTIFNAMGYVSPGWICRVTATGDCKIGNDKSAWSDMVIIKRYKWMKKMSVSLAIYAAELVLKIYEREYPDDARPRNAIAAAKAYLKNPCKETKDAAYAAAHSAAETAYAATYAATAAAAHAAADAAYAAADAAYAATYAATDAPARADYAAARAAYSADAADPTILKKIERKIKQLVGICK